LQEVDDVLWEVLGHLGGKREGNNHDRKENTSRAISIGPRYR
jgi:hypothetical protein